MIRSSLNFSALCIALVVLIRALSGPDDPGQIMAPITAIMFVLACIQSEVYRRKRTNGIGCAVVSACSMATALVLLATLAHGLENSVFASVLGFGNGLSPATYGGGRPAILSIVTFFWLAAAGVLWILGRHRAPRVAGVLSVIVGLVAIVGHLAHIPHLYRISANWSPGMGEMTAACFVLLGLSMTGTTRKAFEEYDA